MFFAPAAAAHGAFSAQSARARGGEGAGCATCSKESYPSTHCPRVDSGTHTNRPHSLCDSPRARVRVMTQRTKCSYVSYILYAESIFFSYMRVSSAVLQPLLGQHHEDDISFHALCSEAGMAESKRS